jgi:4-diphosphocytidyl-2-C-methyl-D-erythritol kinase
MVQDTRMAGDGASIGDVPADSSNLVVRALGLLREQAAAPFGADILLIKRIPSEAGLGGGSSDAAAALAAANVAWGMQWPAERLAAIGADLGSDVPLFFRAGASVCRGRGEVVDSAPTSPLLHFALVRPPVGLSTADVYGACQITSEQRSLPQFLDAFASADIGRIGRSLFNRLERAAAELSPWIERMRRTFHNLDCAGVQMTGSGTCYFGLCRHARHARRVVRRIESYGVGRAYAVRGCR